MRNKLEQKIFVIANPHAGKGRGSLIIPTILRSLNKYSSDFSIAYTTGKNHAIQLASSLDDSFCVVIVIGGDGVLNEVINGLPNGSTLPILLLPIGSGNDFARSIGLINRSPIHILENYFSGKMIIEDVDCGQIVFTSPENIATKRLFVSSCGIGLDALIAKKSNEKSFLKGLPLYLLATFQSIFNFSPMKISGTIDGNNISNTKRKHLISIGNTKTAGGGFKLNPNANISDGLLDITLADELSKIGILKLLPQAINGSHVKHPAVENKTFKIFSIELEEPTYLHSDGEVLSENVIEVEIVVKHRVFKFWK